MPETRVSLKAVAIDEVIERKSGLSQDCDREDQRFGS
jgi:hypothetical protein